MALTTKTKLAKRKRDENSSNKTKAELLEDMNLMKELNDALLEEVKANEAKISNLEKKEKKSLEDIKNLEQKLGSRKQTTIQKGTQTQFDEIRLCPECEYPADDLYDLGEHVGEVHSDKNVCEQCDESFVTQHDLVEHIVKKHKAEADVSNESIPCNFCENIFQGKKEFMKHKKLKHDDKVSKCWNHSTGTCSYGDIECWFIHTDTDQVSAPEFNCKLCNVDFFYKFEYQQHRRFTHPNMILPCKNISNGGTCSYGNRCWFNHDNNIAENMEKFENNEVILKIFDFMEKVTEKISRLENLTK